MGDDERRLLDQRVSELRQEAESKGWKFRIVRESATQVVYKTRQPGYVWRRFSATFDGERELGGEAAGEGDGEKRSGGCLPLVLGSFLGLLVGGIGGATIWTSCGPDHPLTCLENLVSGVFIGALVGLLLAAILVAWVEAQTASAWIGGALGTFLLVVMAWSAVTDSDNAPTLTTPTPTTMGPRAPSPGDHVGEDFSGELLSGGCDAHRTRMGFRDFSGADFTGANLFCNDMTGSIFVDAQFIDANVSGARLDGANLNGADFTGANVSGTRFDGSNSNGANFTGANVLYATFRDAVVCGADFSDVSLISDVDPKFGTGLVGTGYDEHTIWPPGLEVPAYAIAGKCSP